ncbi:hypothetical protein OSTOST_12504, partial [Ostertagia ostertagi]
MMFNAGGLLVLKVHQSYSKLKVNGFISKEKKMFAYPAFGLRNKYLENVEDDYLYHFGFGLKTVDLPKTFGDVK